MKRLTYLLGVVLLAAVACNKEVAAPVENAPANLVPMTFTALSDPDLSKTFLSEDFSIKWTMEDAITVFAGENASGATFTVGSVEDGGASATFTGLSDVSPVYYALSPADENATIASGVISTTLPSVQNAAAGSFGATANLSVAKAESELLEFKNVGAIVSFKIDEADVTSVRLQGLGSADVLSGGVSVSINGGEPSFSVTDGKNYVDLQGSFESGKTYYFVVLPGNFAGGFSLTFTKGASTAVMQNTKAVEIARNGNIFLGDINIPASKWQTPFTPGDKVYIKGLSETENGQELTYISDGYYNTSLGNAGDSNDFPEAYNYEVWARLEAGQPFYLEDENGARYGISADGTTVASVGPGGSGAFSPASSSIYRIRVNLPSGDASVVRLGGIEASLIYTGGWNNNWYNPADYYVGMGQISIPGITMNWGVQDWDPHMVRYRFKFWFNRKGNVDINAWHEYGAVNKANGNPASDNPADSYYYLQPFKDQGWDEVFYFGTWLYDENNNGRYTATLNLYMNNAYGHFTHGFSDVVDTMADPDAGAPMTLAGSGAETGRTFNIVSAEMFANPDDRFSEIPGTSYGYEIFASLTAGQPVWFERGGKMYTISGENVVAITSASDAMTVATDGAYRIRVWMPDGKATALRIKEAKFRLCPTGYDEADLAYEGAGVFAMRNHSLNWQDTDWWWDHNADSRYKLWFTYETADGDVTQAYGNNGNGDCLEALSGEHLNLQPVNSSQWDNAKKIPYPIFEGKEHGSCFCDLEVYMNFSKQEGHYTQVWIAR